MAHVEVAYEAKASLGECPVWNAREQRLYWTDVHAETINVFDPASGGNKAHKVGSRINSFGFRADGGIVAANWDGLAYVDLQTGAIEQIWRLPQIDGVFFLNDGRCDRAGRYWAGSVCRSYDLPGSRLYCLEPDGTVTAEAEGLLASNGIAFSPDDRVMYYADSRVGIVWAFDFDLESGAVRNRRVFANMLRPDGATVDSDGCYWVASFTGGEVLRFTPAGAIDQRIQFPTTQISMCAFGGPALDTLFVTTGTYRLTPEQAAAQPLAGALFAVTGLGVRGVPEPEFAG
jgi:L-arabinonolactonase